MAGIYIHIPFCKKACHYCDFHFSTSLKYMEEMVSAISAELVLKKNRASGPIGSIYFGGGTPSLLSEAAFHKLFDTILANYELLPNAEITIEANPDDLTNEKIKFFRTIPVNRFSIGVQSFFDEDLLWMNRAHTSGEAESSIKRSQDAGFENLTVDLIYGYPLLTDKKWNENIQNALDFQIPHISAYSLTVEDRTALAASIKKGIQPPLNDAQSAAQFITLINSLTNNGYEHYEISNFAKPGCYAVHNTNYWKGVPYIGIGPSAHGFEGNKRYFNVANNNEYLKALLNGKLAENIELLSLQDQANEYMMTSLRTMWGMDLQHIEQNFGPYFKAIKADAQPYIEAGRLQLKQNNLTLSLEGKLFADQIAAALFVMNDD